ncbi:MAG: hypothetical protein ACRDJP_11660, partial [Actinomycetota bacterium]
EFFKGLSQLGAGYTHYRRGNLHGTHTLMRRALSRIAGHRPAHRGIELDALVEEVERQAAVVEEADRSGGPMPEIEPPGIEAAA